MKLKSLGLASMLLLMLVVLSFRVVSLQQMGLTASSSSLASRAPILIDGDANFTAANGVTGGSGTALDLYIIEGWDINAATANGIEIRNTRAYFTIRNVTVHDGKPNNFGAIRLENVTHGIVMKVTSTNNVWAVNLLKVSNTKVQNNTATNDGYILVDNGCRNNVIAFNSLGGTSQIGIEGDYNDVIGNTITGWGNGISLGVYSSFNNVIDNKISPPGIWYGIAIYGNNHTIMGNDVSGGSRAILLGGTQGSNITGNYAHNSGSGIVFSHSALSSPNNYIVGNIVTGNSYGIYFGELPSSGNLIYNNYLSNSLNARDHGTNSWNVSKTIGNSIAGGPYLGGNYYSDYTGTDADGDGIGDTSYPISGGSNVDQLPLVQIPPVVKTFNATWNEVIYPVKVFAPNCTLDGFDFNHALGQISLTITAGTTRYCNVTVPKSLLDGAFVVRTEDTPIPSILTWNTTHTSIYFTLGEGIHNMKVMGEFVTRVPVGGLTIPVDKFSLLAPYIALVSTIILATSASVAYIKYKKKQ